MKYTSDTLSCLVCGSGPPVDLDHITTRGAGGKDDDNNFFILCRKCHTERHQIGLITFIKKYPNLKSWLKDKGRQDILDKLGDE